MCDANVVYTPMGAVALAFRLRVFFRGIGLALKRLPTSPALQRLAINSPQVGIHSVDRSTSAREGAVNGGHGARAVYSSYPQLSS